MRPHCCNRNGVIVVAKAQACAQENSNNRLKVPGHGSLEELDIRVAGLRQDEKGRLGFEDLDTRHDVE